MDIFAHTLWAVAGAKEANKISENKNLPAEATCSNSCLRQMQRQ